jgi:anti-sigma B factor antagonist
VFHHNELEINRREEQGIVILGLRGKLEMGRGDVALRDYAGSLLAQGNRQLILDLAGVTSIDTAGSGELLLLAERYREAGGKMSLMHVDRVHAKIYELASLETAMEIYPDQLEAVNSFFPGRTPTHYDILDYVESQVPHEDHKE